MRNECHKYVNLYFGSLFRYTWPNGEWIEDNLVNILFDDFLCGVAKIDNEGKSGVSYEINNFTKSGQFNLILTHIDDIPADIKKEYYCLCKYLKKHSGKYVIVDTPLSFAFLLENGIDVFNLIDKGIAFDINQERILKKPSKKIIPDERFIEVEREREQKIFKPISDSELFDVNKENNWLM